MAERDIGRNDPCWCGSGKKYKKCHMAEDKAAERQRVARGDRAGASGPSRVSKAGPVDTCQPTLDSARPAIDYDGNGN